MKSLTAITQLFASDAGQPSLTVNYYRSVVETFFFVLTKETKSGTENRNLFDYRIGFTNPALKELGDLITTGKTVEAQADVKYFLRVKYYYNRALKFMIHQFENHPGFASLRDLYESSDMPNVDFLDEEIKKYEAWYSKGETGQNPHVDKSFIEIVSKVKDMQSTSDTSLSYRVSDFTHLEYSFDDNDVSSQNNTDSKKRGRPSKNKSDVNQVSEENLKNQKNENS